MLKFLLIAALGYFIFSRLFGKIIIIKKAEFKANNKEDEEPSTRIKVTEKESKSIDTEEGDYIDYEEIR